MKTWKLVSGILSMILFVVVAVQSCAAGMVNALEDSGGTSGSIGIFVGILMLSGGIVSVATRKSQGKGDNIALVILFGLAALMGFAGYGNYSDLVIWAFWCLINAIFAVVAIVNSFENCITAKNVSRLASLLLIIFYFVPAFTFDFFIKYHLSACTYTFENHNFGGVLYLLLPIAMLVMWCLKSVLKDRIAALI